MRKRQPSKVARLTKILVETDALLAALKHYRLFGRYLPTFPEKPYFLFSQCARMLHEFEVAREGSDMSTEPGNDHFMRFLGKIYLCRLSVFRCAGQPVVLPGDTGPFRNESAWFRFWLDVLKETECITCVEAEKAYQSLLGCVGGYGALNAEPDKSKRKAVNRFFKTAEAGRLIVHSEWILEDISTAIMSWLTKCDVEEHITGLLQATACALGQERRLILWSAAPTGPYRLTRDGCWGGAGGLAGYRLRGTKGKLTIAMRDDGGKIACVFEWRTNAALRQKSWLVDTSKFHGSYEKALFETWAYDTGVFAKGPREMQETPASWQIERLDADYLDFISRWTSALVDVMGRHPSYEPLANAIRTKLREGKAKWEPGRIHWTYIKEMDALIRTIDSIRLKDRSQGKPVDSVYQPRPELHDRVGLALTMNHARRGGENGEEGQPESGSIPSGSALGPRPLSKEDSHPILFPIDSISEDLISPGLEGEMDHGGPEKSVAEGSQPQAKTCDDSVPIDQLRFSSQSGSHADAAQDRGAKSHRETQHEVLTDKSRREADRQEATGQRAQQGQTSRTDIAESSFQAGPSTAHEAFVDDPVSMGIQRDTKPCRSSLSTQWACVVDGHSSNESASNKAEQHGQRGEPVSEATCASVKADPKEARRRLVTTLLKYHCPSGGTVNYEPLSRKQLQEDLEWTESEVQRVMADVFGRKPFTVYKLKCREMTIDELLKDLTLGHRPAKGALVAYG